MQESGGIGNTFQKMSWGRSTRRDREAGWKTVSGEIFRSAPKEELKCYFYKIFNIDLMLRCFCQDLT